MAITVDQAYAIDPNTGQVNMDLFKQYAAQQESSLADMRANTQLSAPLQTLQANPELLDQAVSTFASQGVAPGLDFQSKVEDFAVQSPERRYLIAHPDVASAAEKEFRDMGASSYENIPAYQDTFARRHYYGTPGPYGKPSFGIDEGYDSFGMALPDVNPSLLNIARITSGITDRIADGDNDDINVPAYIFNEAIPDAQSLANTYYDIGQGFKTKVLGEGSNANSDMAGLDMSSFLQTAYAPRGNYNRSMVDNLGGYSELLRAYDQLGVTGDGDTYADRQVRGVLDQFRANSSSINSDGTGGSIDAGTADVGNFSLENAYNAFAPMPPSGPIGLAFCC